MRLGLTGGIAAGKSEVAKRLSARGALIIDHDQLSRQVVEPGSVGLFGIGQEFGPQVLNRDGTLNRGALGEIIFNDPAAREKLNAIVHPLVKLAGREAEEKLRRKHPDAIIIHDIPLLAEVRKASSFDGVIVVHAPEELRVARLRERGLSEAEAKARISSQASDARRFAIATWLIDAGGTLEDLETQLNELWADVCQTLPVE